MQVANLHVWLRRLGTLDLEVPYVPERVRTEPGAVHTWECTYGTTKEGTHLLLQSYSLLLLSRRSFFLDPYNN